MIGEEQRCSAKTSPYPWDDHDTGSAYVHHVHHSHHDYKQSEEYAKYGYHDYHNNGHHIHPLAHNQDEEYHSYPYLLLSWAS